MIKIVDKIRLFLLKKKAIKLNMKINNDMDCGENLKNYIVSGRISLIKKYMETWDKICELDPSAPKPQKELK